MKKIIQFIFLISLFICCKKDGVTTPAVKTVSINLDKATNFVTVVGEVTSEGSSAVTKRGFCWSTVNNPTVSDASTTNEFGPGKYSTQISGLALGTTYYIKSYATNSSGTSYGNQIEFKTLSAGKFGTLSFDSLFFRSARINVNIENLGEITIKSLGVCYSKSGTPSVKNDSTTVLHSNVTDKVFSIGLNNLDANTKYFIRAFINTNLGIFYSDEINLTTKQYTPGVLGDIVISSLTNIDADARVNITSLGDAPINSIGICYSTVIDPVFKTDSSTLLNTNNTDQLFTKSLKNLKENTKYYIRSFINSEAGIVYSKNFYFTTLGRPTIGDINPNGAITRTSAVLDSYVVSENGGQVSENGFIFGDKKIIVPVNSSLKINYQLSSLIGNTNYSVYAFATNKYGTGLSRVYNFLTGPTEPVISTNIITDIFSTKAYSGVTVTSNGGSALTEIGICLSTKSSPTISDRFYAGSLSNPNNKILLSSLSYDSTYYIRAYAKNNVGITYGLEKSFTTVYQIGETGPAGGFIFYDKGSKSDGWRYLEAAVEDLKGNTININQAVSFSPECITSILTNDGFGEGLKSTELLNSNCTGEFNVAKIALNYKYNNYDDWYLPTIKEFNEFITKLIILKPNSLGTGIGSFASNTMYFVSTTYKRSVAPFDYVTTGFLQRFGTSEISDYSNFSGFKEISNVNNFSAISIGNYGMARVIRRFQ